ALSRCAKPPARKSRPLQPATDRRHAAHMPPHEIVAVIRRLQQDRPLVDPEIVAAYPAMPWVNGPVLHLHVRVGEARIEAVLETVAVEYARLLQQCFSARNHDLGRKRQRPERRRRRDRPVVKATWLAHRPPRRIARELSRLSFERFSEIAWAVAG